MAAPVLFAMPHLTFGGAEKLVASLIRDLAARQVRCLIAVATRSPVLLDASPIWFAPICAVHQLHAEKDLAGALIDLINREDVATLVVCGGSPAFDALPRIAGARPDIRVVSFQFNAVDFIPANRRYAPFIDLVIAESLDATLALGAGGEGRPPVRVIPSGVDVTAIQARPRAPRDGDTLNVAYVGRFDETKNPLDFVRMAALLGDDGTRLMLAGDGPLLPNARELAKALGLASRVHFHGFLDDEPLQEVMDQIDILVVPSMNDGRPMVVQELQARGAAVVATAVGDIPNLVRDGVSGLLCPPGDPAALAQAVTRLVNDPALRARVGKAGAERARRDGDIAFSLPLYAAAILGPAGA
jgi:glycosyltransferase involved in cell wall biosynthesis